MQRKYVCLPVVYHHVGISFSNIIESEYCERPGCDNNNCCPALLISGEITMMWLYFVETLLECDNVTFRTARVYGRVCAYVNV